MVKHGLYFSVKDIFSKKKWGRDKNGGEFSSDSDVIIGYGPHICGGIYNEESTF